MMINWTFTFISTYNYWSRIWIFCYPCSLPVIFRVSFLNPRSIQKIWRAKSYRQIFGKKITIIDYLGLIFPFLRFDPFNNQSSSNILSWENNIDMISENSAENVAFRKIIQMRKELIRATRSRKRLNIKHDNKTGKNKKMY